MTKDTQKEETLYQDIVAILADPEVQEHPDCLQLFVDAKNRLDKDEAEWFVAARLSESISLYLMTHEYKVPEKVLDFSKELASAPAKYRGAMSVPFWLTQLF